MGRRREGGAERRRRRDEISKQASRSRFRSRGTLRGGWSDDISQSAHRSWRSQPKGRVVEERRLTKACREHTARGSFWFHTHDLVIGQFVSSAAYKLYGLFPLRPVLMRFIALRGVYPSQCVKTAQNRFKRGVKTIDMVIF